MAKTWPEWPRDAFLSCLIIQEAYKLHKRPHIHWVSQKKIKPFGINRTSGHGTFRGPSCGYCCCHCRSHRKVHVFSSAKNNIYLINFGGEIGQSKSINLSENFRIA